MDPINTPTRKEEAVLLYKKGFFGNKGLTWDNLKDYFNSDYEGRVLVRSKKGFGGGICLHDLTKEEVKRSVKSLSPKELDKIWINAAFPKEKVLVQGELTQIPEWYFYCSFVKKHMRNALEENAIELKGLKAKETLKYLMTPSSFQDLEQLLELFPNSVIELSVYNINVGKFPYRNTMFWEVRNY